MAVLAVPIDCANVDVYNTGDIPLQPGAQVVGRVVDNAGLPITEGDVVLRPVRREVHQDGALHHELFFKERLAANGGFLFSSIPQGMYTVTAMAKGFVWLEADAVACVAGVEAGVGDLVLGQGASVSGRVIGPEGGPVAGASVFVTNDSQSRLGPKDSLALDLHWVSRSWVTSATAITEGDGSFHAYGLLDGEVNLWVDAEGMEIAARTGLKAGLADVRIDLVRQAELAVEFVGDTDSEVLQIEFFESYRLTGFDLEADVEPLPEVLPRTGGVRRIGRVGGYGTAVLVHALGYAPMAIYLSGVAPGEVRAERLVLQRGASVSGRVTDWEGQAIEGAVVLAARSGRSKYDPLDEIAWREERSGVARRTAATNEVGDFFIDSLTPGVWSFSCQSGVLGSRVISGVSVPPDGVLADIVFVGHQPGAVFGNLRTENGDQVPWRVVSAKRVDPNSDAVNRREAVTDGCGFFYFGTLLPGRWVLQCEQQGEIGVTVCAGEEVVQDLIALADGSTAAVDHDDGEGRIPVIRAPLESRVSNGVQDSEGGESDSDNLHMALFEFDDDAFPSLQPFLDSEHAYSKSGRGYLSIDPLIRQEFVAEMIKGSHSMTRLYDKAEKYGAVSELSRLIQKSWTGALPPVLETLRPVWSLANWTEEDVLLAQTVARYLRLHEGVSAPSLSFSIHTASENQQSLMSLVSWFESFVRVPQHYADMLALLSYGPFVAREAPVDREYVHLDECWVGDGYTLTLAKPAKGNRFPVLSCTQGGAPIWSVMLSDALESEGRLAFGNPPEDISPYGWRVTIDSQSRIYVFLDSALEIIVYYVEVK